jgi:hypothetical protein
MANTIPITPIDEVGINKVITARIDMEALATTKKALIKGTIKDK